MSSIFSTHSPVDTSLSHTMPEHVLQEALQGLWLLLKSHKASIQCTSHSQPTNREAHTNVPTTLLFLCPQCTLQHYNSFNLFTAHIKVTLLYIALHLEYNNTLSGSTYTLPYTISAQPTDNECMCMWVCLTTHHLKTPFHTDNT